MSTPLNGSILKSFEILSLFSSDRREISTAQVVEQLQMNSATAHRLLLTLESVGALRAARRGIYILGPKIEELCWIAEESNSLAAVVRPELDRMSLSFNESVMACRLSRYGPTCIAVADSRRTISVNIKVGTLLPMHLSAQGKLWLADLSPQVRAERLEALSIADRSTPKPEELLEELDTVRRQGFAINLGDNEPDIAAVAVPVRNLEGRMILTISVFGMLSRFREEFIETARLQLSEVARQVGRRL